MRHKWPPRMPPNCLRIDVRGVGETMIDGNGHYVPPASSDALLYMFTVRRVVRRGSIGRLRDTVILPVCLARTPYTVVGWLSILGVHPHPDLGSGERASFEAAWMGPWRIINNAPAIIAAANGGGS